MSISSIRLFASPSLCLVLQCKDLFKKKKTQTKKKQLYMHHALQTLLTEACGKVLMSGQLKAHHQASQAARAIIRLFRIEN